MWYICPSASQVRLEQLKKLSVRRTLILISCRYASLLSQYSAVSFGDALFGCFVTLPLAQKHDVKFRRAVWDEHIGVLRALSIPLDQVNTEKWKLRLWKHVAIFFLTIRSSVQNVPLCQVFYPKQEILQLFIFRTHLSDQPRSQGFSSSRQKMMLLAGRRETLGMRLLSDQLTDWLTVCLFVSLFGLQWQAFIICIFSFLYQLPIPLEEFLYPVEQNQSLLALYLRALATQAVR